MEVGILVAFVGGILSFASPCCLPLVPAYVAYMVGTATEGPGSRRRTLFHGLAFVTGFTIVFVAFWASIGAVGYVLADQAVMLRRIGGIVLVILGLQVAGVINLRALWRDTRPMPAMAGGPGFATTTTGTPSYGRSLALGTFFAAGWSPCIGPILGGILGLAMVTSSVAQGTVLLVAYAAGLAVPFLAVALGADWVAHRLTWIGRHHRAVSAFTGAALILIGVLMITDTLARLATLTSPLGS
ncbi:MAG: cytochrome C biogenesis protein [Chloroflexi bacterium RBG_16_69_14]|nr:MAG: cytochrome C biogenesis protein [Chloroflexi bacterium RBG_16_69_14]